MIKTRTKFWILLICSLAAAAVFIFACSEDEPTEPELESPQIPPVSTFLMDFGEFAIEDKAAPVKGPATELLSQDNYNWAALHIGVWNLIITVGLAVPVATFAESFSHRPEQQPDGSWVWSYDLTVDGDLYSATLHGSLDNTGTDWEMTITKEGEYQDFMWYSGQADLFLTEGTWTLNKHPDEPVPFVGIEWHRDIEDSTADIKYTNIEPGSAENGGFIFYGTSTDTTYDAFYDIYNKGQNHLIEVEWHRTKGDGRVRDTAHYLDGDWHCWDGDLQDIECP